MNKLTCFSLGALLLAVGLGAACQQPSVASNNAATTASPAAKPATDPMPPATQNQEDAMPRVKAEEAKAEVAKGTAVVIDVRGTDSYKIAHIKGALDYPLSRLEQGDFKDIPQGKRIIAYCT
jgi:hypothetical protein